MNDGSINTPALAQATQHLQAGKLAEAEIVCNLHLTMQPEDHRAYQIMALIQHQLGNRDLAVEHIGRATELAPGEAAYHANHGAILHAYGDNENALAAYRRARDTGLAPGDVDRAIGLILDTLERPKEASEAYRRALSVSRDDAVLHHNLGNALLNAGDIDGAADSFRRYIALQPDIPDGYYNLAMILQESGDYASVLENLREAIKLAPDVALYHLALGKAELARGNDGGSYQAFREALRLDPDGKFFNLPKTVADIDGALERGNLAHADQLCRFAMVEFPPCPWWPYYRALFALQLNLRETAQQWLAMAKRSITEFAPVRFETLEARLAEIETKLELQPQHESSTAPSYLLIKCWGYGFWAIVSHVMSSLLLAEMTGRIPVIHWGSNCKYTDSPEDDAFQTFYLPRNDATLSQITSPDFDYFPDKWNATNLKREDVNIWTGRGSRQSGLYFLNRPEKVVVSDFYTQISELLPWLEAGHPLYGSSVPEAFQYLYRKYFKFQPPVQQEVDDFIQENFADRPIIGVHIRNIEKGAENPRFEEEQAQIMPIVMDYLERIPDLRIFLLTDSSEALTTWQRQFGERVFNAECTLRSDRDARTWDDVDSRYRLGVEIIKDTYAAAACDYFVGLGCSNVAGMVVNLKNWNDEDLHIIGANAIISENRLLHDW
jgi:Flp pilus assembly protein TadD